MKKNTAIDAYIEKSAPFAKPVLIHLRKLVNDTCHDVEEKIKWGMPFFDYKGPLCNMAAFKQHCSFGFWKGALMKDPILHRTAESEVAMGHLGRLTSVKDLPSDKKMIAYIKEAMQLNEDGIKTLKVKKVHTEAITIPSYFTEQLNKNTVAKKHFNNFTVAKQREYINWIEEAKTEPTRVKRMAQSIEWIAEGKSRNWKYQN
jgi:uncharacterized protein YdeI (YjbR/CyaY-like superfamily)